MTRRPPPGGPDADTLAEAVARIADPSYDHWAAQAAAAGWCARPVRLTGTLTRADRATGEVTDRYTTTSQPDGVLLKACGTRRATLCPACANLYRYDARQLILAGLQGGKGMPDTVAARPTAFVTLTAPSYGPVHHNPGQTCRPRPATTCPHGRPRSCGDTHTPDDPRLGQPICPDCYDHTGTILFNAHAGALWRRTIIAARRRLARHLGVPVRAVHGHAAINYLKVVEYQQRGVVHLHVLTRLDPGTDQPDDDDPVGDGTLLVDVIAGAARTARIPHPTTPGATVRWGHQLDISVLANDQRRRAAAYIAKYATKSTDHAGALDHRIRHPGNIDDLELTDHHRRLVAAAWEVGDRRDLAHLNLHAWAHTLGYRGHWLTKSRGWSTTFGDLRAARHHWQLARHGHDPDQPAVGDWNYHGTGHTTRGDTWLATTAAHNHQQDRRTAWEER